MGLSRKSFVLASILCLAGSVLGQATPVTTPAAPASKPAVPAQPILEMIPAGSAGFVVVNNVNTSLLAVKQYLKEIGVADLAALPADLLPTLKAAAQLGDGFNPDGGFGACLLDPQPFGIDVLKMMDPNQPSTANAKLPFLLFIPGGGLKDVSGAYKMELDGAYTKVALRMGPMFAVEAGGYIVLSPMKEALDAFQKTKAKALSELSKDQVQVAASSALAFHVNMKIAGPIYAGAMKMALEQMGEEIPLPLKGLANVMPAYGKILLQVQSVLLAVDLAKTGLVLHEQVVMDPNSDLGRMFASAKAGEQAKIDRLPNLPYILAVGAVVSGSKEAVQMNQDMIDAFLKSMPSVTEEQRKKITQIVATLNEQITAKQLVAGGSPEGSGVFGLAAVLTCKDSQAVKATLADGIDPILAVVKSLAPGKELDKLQIKYVKDADKADALSIDAIEITPPSEMTQEDKDSTEKILGDSKIRILVASPDNNTVVLTFGGGKAMLAEALKAAKGGGALPDDKGIVEAMKNLPAQPKAVILLNVANLLTVVNRGAQATGEGSGIPFKIASDTPIALGAGWGGNAVHVAIYVPNQLVKEIVGVVTSFLIPSGGGRGGPPVPGGENF